MGGMYRESHLCCLRRDTALCCGSCTRPPVKPVSSCSTPACTLRKHPHPRSEAETTAVSARVSPVYRSFRSTLPRNRCVAVSALSSIRHGLSVGTWRFVDPVTHPWCSRAARLSPFHVLPIARSLARSISGSTPRWRWRSRRRRCTSGAPWPRFCTICAWTARCHGLSESSREKRCLGTAV